MKGWSKFWVSLKLFPLGLGWNWTDVYLTILYNIDQYWRILTSTPFAAWLVEWLPASERLHITGCQSWHRHLNTTNCSPFLDTHPCSFLSLHPCAPPIFSSRFGGGSNVRTLNLRQVLTVDSQVEFKLTQTHIRARLPNQTHNSLAAPRAPRETMHEGWSKRISSKSLEPLINIQISKNWKMCFVFVQAVAAAAFFSALSCAYSQSFTNWSDVP